LPPPVEVPSQVEVPLPKSPVKEKSSPKFGTVPESGEPLASLDLPEPSISQEAMAAAAAAASVEAIAAEEEVAGEDEEEEEEQNEDDDEDAAPTVEVEDVHEDGSDKKADEAATDTKEAAPAPPNNLSWAERARAAANKPDVPKPAVPAKKKPAAAPVAPAAEAEKEDAAAGEDEAPRKERAPYKADPAEKEASVFVSGVPNTCGEDRLKELFGKHGEVVKVSLKAEKHFAIIDFDTAEAAASMLQTTVVKCDGSIMKVEPRRRAGATGGKPRGGKGDSRGSGERGRGRGKDGGSRGGGGGKRAPRESH